MRWRYVFAAPFVLYGLAYGWAVMNWRHHYFKPAEFGAWLPFLNSEWLEKADQLRHRHGDSIYVSPVTGAIGRAIDEGQEGHGSQHNLLLNGVVNAVDVFPAINGRPLNADELAQFVDNARAVGFRGIGIYPDTLYRGRRWPMVHLDVRPGDRVATWGRYGGGAEPGTKRRYVSLAEAMNKLRNMIG